MRVIHNIIEKVWSAAWPLVIVNVAWPRDHAVRTGAAVGCRLHSLRRSRPVAAVLAGGLALAACTADSEAPQDDALPPAESTSVIEEEPPDADKPAPEEPSDGDAVVDSYGGFLAALTAAMDAGDPDLTELTGTATDDALLSAQAMVVSLVDAGRTARGDIVPSIETIVVEDDFATLEDCYRLDLVEYDPEADEQVADRGGARFQASAALIRNDDDHWVVTEFVEGDVCAPTEIADTVADRYLAFWDAVWDAADPPDPDHPGLADTAAGDHLVGLRAQLTQLRDDGHVRRGRGTEHPVVVYVTAHDTQALVRDCVEEDPETGIYDATSGERVEGGTEEGQRTLLETRLKVVDGDWRVVNVRVEEEDSSCEPGAA